MPDKGRIIHFDPETYTAIQQLADDRMASLQELADEAFTLLLKKYGRPVGIKAQLKESVSVKCDMATVQKRYRTPTRPRGHERPV